MGPSLPYITRFEVRIGDINYGGHMGNDKALLLFQDARIRFLESAGFSEKHIGDQAGIIMSDAHVVFRKEIFLHEILLVSVSVTDITTSSFTLEFKVIREHDQAEVLNGSTKLIAFDYERRKVVRLPEVFIRAIRQ
jgi:acyl-CoA thioesterase FadM